MGEGAAASVGRGCLHGCRGTGRRCGRGGRGRRRARRGRGPWCRHGGEGVGSVGADGAWDLGPRGARGWRRRSHCRRRSGPEVERTRSRRSGPEAERTRWTVGAGGGENGAGGAYSYKLLHGLDDVKRCHRICRQHLLQPTKCALLLCWCRGETNSAYYS